MTQIELVGPVSDAEAAWRLIADTDRMNRDSGAPPFEVEFATAPDGLSMMRGHFLDPILRTRHEFEESEVRWIQGRSFRQVREMKSPVLKRTVYEARIEPADSGVRPVVRMGLEPASWASAPVVAAGAPVLRGRWTKLLESLPPPGRTEEPAARRELGPEVRAALHRWRERGTPSELVDRTAQHLRTALDRDLGSLRPYALAAEWRADPDDVLAAFLDGALAGAMQLYWAVRCDRCSMPVAGSPTLSNLADHAACPSCRVDTRADLADTVEVLFAAPPNLVPGAGARYCTQYPALVPHVAAVFVLPPGGRDEAAVRLGPGSWRIGPGGEMPDLPVEVGSAGADRIEWRPDRDPKETVQVRSGEVELSARNETDRRLRVIALQSGAIKDRVPASRIATMPRYRRQFGPLAVSPDVRIGVKLVAVLFTDLKGSTALYERLGDAGAWACVRDHFNLLEKVVEDFGGVRVKTVGDALMAAFDAPVRAARASLAMQRAFLAWTSGEPDRAGLSLRIGVHAGPALVVHSDNAGLDYFGGTVNLAARAEAKADGGETVWTEAVANDPLVRELVEGEKLEIAQFEASLKGFATPVPLLRVRWPERA